MERNTGTENSDGAGDNAGREYRDHPGNNAGTECRDHEENGSVVNTEDRTECHIPEGWIDAAGSDAVTETYGKLCAQDGAYLNRVIVVRNPDLPKKEASVEDDNDRMLYILVTVVPDVPLVYELNFPIVQTMGIMGLFAWEFSRATTMASRELAEVKFAKKPIPPILNNARVEWVSLYVGKNGYRGGTSISSNYLEADEDSFCFDIHLFRAREMAGNSAVMQLVEAYDADCAEAADGSAVDAATGNTDAD